MLVANRIIKQHLKLQKKKSKRHRAAPKENVKEARRENFARASPTPNDLEPDQKGSWQS